MPHLHCYVPEPLARQVQARPEAAGVSTSHYLAELIRRDVGSERRQGYFDQIVGGWQGEELLRPEQPAVEEWDAFGE